MAFVHFSSIFCLFREREGEREGRGSERERERDCERGGGEGICCLVHVAVGSSTSFHF